MCPITECVSPWKVQVPPRQQVFQVWFASSLQNLRSSKQQEPLVQCVILSQCAGVVVAVTSEKGSRQDVSAGQGEAYTRRSVVPWSSQLDLPPHPGRYQHRRPRRPLQRWEGQSLSLFLSNIPTYSLPNHAPWVLPSYHMISKCITIRERRQTNDCCQTTMTVWHNSDQVFVSSMELGQCVSGVWSLLCWCLLSRCDANWVGLGDYVCNTVTVL